MGGILRDVAPLYLPGICHTWHSWAWLAGVSLVTSLFASEGADASELQEGHAYLPPFLPTFDSDSTVKVTERCKGNSQSCMSQSKSFVIHTMTRLSYSS